MQLATEAQNHRPQSPNPLPHLHIKAFLLQTSAIERQNLKVLESEHEFGFVNVFYIAILFCKRNDLKERVHTPQTKIVNKYKVNLVSNPKEILIIGILFFVLACQSKRAHCSIKHEQQYMYRWICSRN